MLVVGDGGGAWGSWSGGVSAAPVENKALPGIQGGASSFLGEVSLRSVDPFFWLAGELLLFLSVGLGRLKEATTNLVRFLFLPLLVVVGDSVAVRIRWRF